MRVLIIPELYHRNDCSANGTLNDAITWIDEWLDHDPTLHAYVLLPDDALGELLTETERVTPIGTAPLPDLERAGLLTEGGYSTDQLAALGNVFHSRDRYIDIVIDQRRTGRFTLYKWLLEGTDQWAAEIQPFDIIANVHDLQVPFKYRYCSHRSAFHMWMEIASALFSDGIWITAGVDAERLRTWASSVFRPAVVDATLDVAVVVGSPIDFEAFEERYAGEPTVLHLAGSLWEKKHIDRLIDIGRTLYDRYGVRTVMTSMDDIPMTYHNREWIEAHSAASREVYERALARGDLAVCASEYETMARTPFEQAASGQVLLLHDNPWIDDCTPENYRLAGALDDLPELAAWAVEHWDEAIAESRRLVEYTKRKRSPERIGNRTYTDLRQRIQRKLAVYDGGKQTDIVQQTVDDLSEPFALDTIVEQTAMHTEDGVPLVEQSSYALIDLVYTLRALGYIDIGNPGVPLFCRRDSTYCTTSE